jgi:hypothetical protein
MFGCFEAPAHQRARSNSERSFHAFRVDFVYSPLTKRRAYTGNFYAFGL